MRCYISNSKLVDINQKLMFSVFMDAGVPTSMQKLMFKGLYNLLHSFLLIHNQI